MNSSPRWRLQHNKLGGSSLGPETRQLNRVLDGENLLDKLERLSLFDAPLPKPYLPALATPYDSFEGKPPAGASNEELTRSYLHANCAFCHRADGNSGTLDLRYDVSLANTGACNTPPLKGGAGLSTYTILTPGKPHGIGDLGPHANARRQKPNAPNWHVPRRATEREARQRLDHLDPVVPVVPGAASPRADHCECWRERACRSTLLTTPASGSTET